MEPDSTAVDCLGTWCRRGSNIEKVSDKERIEVLEQIRLEM